MADTIKQIKCTCQNEYQDKKYGFMQRVANRIDKARNAFRCTVCNREHSFSDDTKK